MITRLLLDFFAGLVGFATGLLPTVAPPAWIADGSGYLRTIFEAGHGLGAWVPWSVVTAVVAVVLACLAVSFGIKVVRIVASFLTAGGGSAA
jgi:hypothetical protein